MDSQSLPPNPQPVDNTSTQVVDSNAKVKPAWYWIKDAQGYGSVTVTLVFVSFWITTLAYVASIVEQVGPIKLRPFDIAACSAYFIPILTLYFGRKWTDANVQR
jgi:hypothetical protein